MSSAKPARIGAGKAAVSMATRRMRWTVPGIGPDVAAELWIAVPTPPNT